MFADLADSTVLAEQFDPEDVRDVLRSFHRLCAETVLRHEGHVARYMGDGVLIYFGYPKAHADAAAEAVHAGLEILAGIATLNEAFPGLAATPLAARAGIHAGTVFIGDMGHGERVEHADVVGDTPNIAARLQALAGRGQLLVSHSVHTIVAGSFDFESLGTHPLKGITEPMEVYRAIGASRTNQPSEQRLVGRETEIASIMGFWTRAGPGVATSLHLWGEPGVGKSSIVRAVETELDARHAKRVRLRCSERHESSAFSAIGRYIREDADIGVDEPPLDALDKLAASARARGLDPLTSVPFLASLLSVPLVEPYTEPSISAEGRRRQLVELAAAWIVPPNAGAPLAVIIEDLHWADASTLEVLALAAANLERAGGLLLASSRADQHAVSVATDAVALHVDRMSHSDAARVVRGWAGSRALTAEEVERILQAAEGIPLYLEQFARDVSEARLAAGRAAIPVTLQDSLTARLDRLDEGRVVAEVAAVIGRGFTKELLRALLPDDVNLEASLKGLADADIVRLASTPAGPIYRFTHSLIQRSAYESIVRERRTALHARVADVLVADYPSIARDQPERVAYHYEAAGDAERSIEYLERAASRSSARYELVESMQLSARALDLLATVPASSWRDTKELSVLFLAFTAGQLAEGYGSEPVRVLLDRYLALSDQLAEPLSGALSRLYTASLHMSRGDSASSTHMSDLAVERADALGISQLTLATVSVQSGCRLMAGNYEGAAAASDRGLEILAADRSPWAGSNMHPAYLCAWAGALGEWALGDFEAAVERAAESLAPEFVDGLDPMGVGAAHFARGWLHFLNSDHELAFDDYRAALRIANEQGMRWLQLASTSSLAAAMFDFAPGDDSAATLEAAVGTYESPTGPPVKHLCKAVLARAWHRRGDTTAALELLAEQQRSAAERGGSFCEEELYRSEAMIHLERADASAALHAFERGVALATARKADGWLVRLALPLAQAESARAPAVDVLRRSLRDPTRPPTTSIERMARDTLA